MNMRLDVCVGGEIVCVSVCAPVCLRICQSVCERVRVRKIDS